VLCANNNAQITWFFTIVIPRPTRNSCPSPRLTLITDIHPFVPLTRSPLSRTIDFSAPSLPLLFLLLTPIVHVVPPCSPLLPHSHRHRGRSLLHLPSNSKGNCTYHQFPCHPANLHCPPDLLLSNTRTVCILLTPSAAEPHHRFQ